MTWFRTSEPVMTVEEQQRASRIGYRASDGTVYAGQNAKGKFIYTWVAGSHPMTYAQYQNRLVVMNTNTRQEWDMPTGPRSDTNELFNNLYMNRAEIGNFDPGLYGSKTKSGSFNILQGITFPAGREWDVEDDELCLWRPVLRRDQLVL